jgi:hypothetical protein
VGHLVPEGSVFTFLARHRGEVLPPELFAERERGRPMRGDRLDVELALHACRWLGHAVLNRPA